MRLNYGTTEDTVKKWVKALVDSFFSWSYGPVQNALGVHGIPDRIACMPMTVTPQMVGRTIGVFVAIECKRPGRRGEKYAGHKGTQVTQLRDIITAHGIAMTVDSEEDIERLRMFINERSAGRDIKPLLIQHLQQRIGEGK